MEQSKIILVTGSNKGIGYGIIEGLLEKKLKHKIILSSRNEELGLKASNTLIEKFPEAKEYIFYHQLDITKEDSTNNLINWLKEKFTKIDYLVNNAGVATRGSEFNIDVCNKTFDVNVYGTIPFTERMIKSNIINKSGKIILVGSKMGTLDKLTNQELKNSFKNAKNYEDLLKLAEAFKTSVVNDTVEKDGWPKNTYSVSKMVVNLYAKVLSFRKEIIENDISVYSCHPGWVRTDMGGDKAPLSIKEGAANEIFLIELPDGIHPEYQGKYFSEFKVVEIE